MPLEAGGVGAITSRERSSRVAIPTVGGRIKIMRTASLILCLLTRRALVSRPPLSASLSQWPVAMHRLDIGLDGPTSLFPPSRQRCGYGVIDEWIDSEQRRDLQSNSIDPVASVGKLLCGFGR